jgi:uncharacterized protein (DUF983 family)
MNIYRKCKNCGHDLEFHPYKDVCFYYKCLCENYELDPAEMGLFP